MLTYHGRTTKDDARLVLQLIKPRLPTEASGGYETTQSHGTGKC